MDYLIKSAGVIILFYICYKVFLEKETFFEANRWFLFSGVIISLITPLITIPIYIVKEAPSYINTINYETSITSSATASLLTFENLVLLTYLLGVTFFFIKFCIELLSVFQLILKNKKEKADNYIYIKTSKKISPFSFFNWIAYNPNSFNPKELEQILTHEKSHAKNLHSLDVLLAQLATVILWFNPFIWLYKNEIEQNLEYIADQNTQDIVNCKKSYQTLLLKTCIPNYQLALANNFFNSKIKKRIVMLHKNKSNNQKLFKIALVLPLLAVFLMSFNTKEIITYAENNSISSIEKEKIEALIITKNFTDEDFENAKKQFAELGVSLKFKSIKRNSNNEIISIKAEFKSEEGNSGNTSIKGTKPIKPITFYYNTSTGEIGFGNPHELHFAHSKNSNHTVDKIHFKSNGNNDKHENVFVFSSSSDDNHNEKHEVIIVDGDSIINQSGDKNVFVFKSDGNKKVITKEKVFHITNGDVEHKVIELKNDDGSKNGVFIIKETKDGNISKEWVEEETENVWVEKKGNKIIIKENQSGDNTIIKGENIKIQTKDGKTPLIIIDGKEKPYSDLEKINPDSIETMTVIKGENAVEKYGDKGKDGVIEITTKE